MKEKVLNLREFQKLLNKNGYEYKGANGSHFNDLSALADGIGSKVGRLSIQSHVE